MQKGGGSPSMAYPDQVYNSHGCLSDNSKLPELAEIFQFRDEAFNNGSMQPIINLTNWQTSVLQGVLMFFNKVLVMYKNSYYYMQEKKC